MMNRRQFLQTSASTLFFPALSFADTETAPKAQFFRLEQNDDVTCELCPHDCFLHPGDRGICGARGNVSGILRTFIFNQTCRKSEAMIESMPLYHFLPGSKVLSVATPGCNMECPYCNTSVHSQFRPEDVRGILSVTPDQLVQEALLYKLDIIAFTYTEPIIAYEWVLETAQLAKKNGVKIVLVTNGFIHEAPLRALAPYLSACKIDLKSFNPEHYKKILKGGLSTVLKTASILREYSVWLEFYVLVVEGFNENPEEITLLCQYLHRECGQVPVFFSRFFPSYKMNTTPSTREELLKQCESIARKANLEYVYLGNLNSRSSTFCPQCQFELIVRENGTQEGIREYRIRQGCCPSCQTPIPGIWENLQ